MSITQRDTVYLIEDRKDYLPEGIESEDAIAVYEAYLLALQLAEHVGAGAWPMLTPSFDMICACLAFVAKRTVFAAISDSLIEDHGNANPDEIRSATYDHMDAYLEFQDYNNWMGVRKILKFHNFCWTESWDEHFKNGDLPVCEANSPQNTLIKTSPYRTSDEPLRLFEVTAEQLSRGYDMVHYDVYDIAASDTDPIPFYEALEMIDYPCDKSTKRW